VTVIAGIAAGDMRRMLAGRRKAVMAGIAGSDDLVMVDRHHRCKHVCRVAVLADVRRLHMGRILAGSFDAVVAADTIATDVDVIKVCRQPAKRAVAVVAGDATGDVGWVLADGNDAVVTGTASPDYLIVINDHLGRKNICVVAVFADIRSLNVCRVLTDCVRAVMAADTGTGDVQMVEIRRQPTDRAVTIIACIAAGNVRCVLTACDHPVVARAAITCYLCVVNRHGGYKGIA